MDRSFRTPEEDEPPGRQSSLFPESQFAASTTRILQKNKQLLTTSLPLSAVVHKIRRPNSKFPISPLSDAFRRRHYASVTPDLWNDWRWQMRNRIRTLDRMESLFYLREEERVAIARHGGKLPVAITPYYASLIDPVDQAQPLRKCAVPLVDEYIQAPGEAIDPLAEDADSPVPGLVHRYPDRALFLVTNVCAVNCRYCTRSRFVGCEQHHGNIQRQWEKAIDYIRATTAVRDVLLSGGDPLTMADEKLAWLLDNLRRIPHVELLRIGTKAPVVMPQRITPTLTNIIKRYHPVWMSIHFTHPAELTPEVEKACARLADAGIPLGSQTVLLAGVNDDVDTMQQLVHGLLRFRVKPYYLYQCDTIVGSSHFRTSVRKGLEIIKGLRGHTTGYAVPNFVIDAPGGGGKIPLLPEYAVGRDGNDILLKSYDGNTYRYPDTIND